MTIHQVPLRFIQTGFGNGVCANQILAVLTPDAAPSKRLLTQARKDKRYIDMTCGRGVKSLLLMIEGRMIGCALRPVTILQRLNSPDYEETENDGEEDA